MDDRLLRIKSLIGEIEEKETELNSLMAGGAVKARKQQECSICQSLDHSARKCPKRFEAVETV